MGFMVYIFISCMILTTHADQYSGSYSIAQLVKSLAEGAVKALLEFTRDGIIKTWNNYKQHSSTSQSSFNTHAPYTILLIGQTGSGKTSFLNLLLNINNIVDVNNNLKTWNTLRRYNNIKLEMTDESMGSKTSNCSIYHTSFNNYKMRIVDTPGFGDTRGMQYDDQHRKNIVEVIKELTYINCIILVINGRETRMTTQLRFVIDGITSIMPDQVRNNIVVMFTNVDDFFQLNFNLLTLKNYIRTDIKHYWYTENPICKLEKIQSQKLKDLYESNFIIESDIVGSLQSAFQQTSERILNMYHIISNFTPIYSDAFSKIYDLQEDIEIRYLSLLTEHTNILSRILDLNDMEQKVKSHASQKEVFKHFNQTRTVENIIMVNTPYHNTLCAHSGCFHNCHENCTLPLTLERGHSMFKGCAAMDATGLTCKVCGHSYQDHYHVRSKHQRVTKTTNYINETLMNMFNEAKSDEERALIALTGMRAEVQEKETKLNETFEQISIQIVEYQKLGLPKSYLRLLQSQLGQIILTVETYTGDQNSPFYKGLLKSKQDLETKILFAINIAETPVDYEPTQDNHNHDATTQKTSASHQHDDDYDEL